MAYEITLNGANFVSEERRRAFEGSLERSHLAKAAEPARDANDREAAAAQTALRADNAPSVADGLEAQAALSGSVDHIVVLESLERGLAQSYDHQSETLRVHQHYLSNEAVYADIFARLMEEQGALYARSQAAPAQLDLILSVLETLGRSIAQFQDHQSQTLSVHSQFLEQQAVYAQSYVDLLQRHYGAVLQGDGRFAVSGSVVRDVKAAGDGHGNGNGRGNGNGNGHSGTVVRGNGHEEPQAQTAPHLHSAPVRRGSERPVAPVLKPITVEETRVATEPNEILALTTATASSSAGLGEALLSIVSEKTGYPAEMLDLEMDMEADLGIDSIKRVEILGALEEAYPDLPAVAPEALAELRTLAQVLTATSGDVGRPAVVHAAPETGSVVPMAHAGQAIHGTGKAATSSIAQDLMAIVSEKTGYPAEMLDLSMDMEADLGIDSIKRVEIMGALQEMHPALGEIEVEALAELRSLESILNHVVHMDASVLTEKDSSKKA